MTKRRDTPLGEFSWQPQPQTAELVSDLIERCCAGSPWLSRLRGRLLAETGTRLNDWVDHLSVAADDGLRARLTLAGYKSSAEGIWTIDSGKFPPILMRDRDRTGLAIRADSVVSMLLAHGLAGRAMVEGLPGAAFRRAKVAEEQRVEVWCVERHGDQRFDIAADEPVDVEAVLRHAERFLLRRRRFDHWQEGFDEARRLILASAEEVGMPRTTDLFFAAERAYWQGRNRAARVQKARQDALGLGWANHDHHTYRSSRQCFASLISVLELMGFQCRERFYAGRDAGWGAQVLEHAEAGVVIFADVDLSPEEVTADFSHAPLPPREMLGTVGLWCGLHGEAFLEAGMHHLECQFDFGAARDQLRACGIETMKPFTDLPYLRQAFTKGEVWPVESGRIEELVSLGGITAQQAATFRERGAVGSHLEILQRDDGYKGFNQTGINEIIRDTDPRTLTITGA